MSANRNFTDQEYELLSSYLDGMLSESERIQLEARLANDDGLRQEFEALRDTVALIKGTGTVRAPRDFRLTQAMIRPSRWLIFPTTTAFSALTAAAAVLLLFFGATLLFTQNHAAIETGQIAAYQQNTEAQVAIQPTVMGTEPGTATIVTDLFYAVTPSSDLQSGTGGADDNGAFASTLQDGNGQEPSQLYLATTSPTSELAAEEAEQVQPVAPSAGLAAQGTPLPSDASETTIQEAPGESLGQAANAPDAAMADQAEIAQTDSDAAERAAQTSMPSTTMTAAPTMTMTVAASPPATATLVLTPPPAPVTVSPTSGAGDFLPLVVVGVGLVLLVVAGVTSWIRWRR